MQAKITKFVKKSMPSKFGTGTWDIFQVKIEGQGEKVFELNGFGKYTKENMKEGMVLDGFISERVWQGKTGEGKTLTFNKITPEYVYKLLVSVYPDIEQVAKTNEKTKVKEVVEETISTEDISPEDPGF